MTNPLHGAIDETQPHSATEGGVSEKLTLLACPFCGARGEVVVVPPPYSSATIRCRDCRAETAICDDEQRAAIAWNSRAALAAEEESGCAYMLHVGFDDPEEYRRAWEAIEALPEVAGKGFLHGSQWPSAPSSKDEP